MASVAITRTELDSTELRAAAAGSSDAKQARRLLALANQLSMTVWDSYTAILDACCIAWNSLMKDAKRITSVTTRNWAQVNV